MTNYRTDLIEVQNTPNGVTTTCYGPISDKVYRVFGTYTLPAPYKHLVPGSEMATNYIAQLKLNWPTAVIIDKLK